MNDLQKEQEITDFLDANNISRNGPLVEFKAVCEYLEQEIVDVSKVRIGLKYDYGNIEIYPTTKINKEVLHTGFSLHFTKSYKLINKTLVIKNVASPQKGGKLHTVKITPFI